MSNSPVDFTPHTNGVITLKIEKKFEGPNLFEMRSLLPTKQAVIVSWGNTAPERAFLRRYPDQDITLVVADMAAMERSAMALGISFPVDPQLRDAAAAAFDHLEDDSWRGFVTSVGANVAQAALLQIIADCICGGRDPYAARKMMVELILGNASPLDADILAVLIDAGAEV